MTNLERLENALESPDLARELRSVVQDLARGGLKREELYQLLEELLVKLRRRENTSASIEDAVLDVMDALSDWCHPNAQLIQDQEAK